MVVKSALPRTGHAVVWKWTNSPRRVAGRLSAHECRNGTDPVWWSGGARVAIGVGAGSPWGGEEELTSPIVVTAWRYLLPLDEADIGAIEAFAREHYGLAPEPQGGPGRPG